MALGKKGCWGSGALWERGLWERGLWERGLWERAPPAKGRLCRPAGFQRGLEWG